jgi:hypothetical protein
LQKIIENVQKYFPGMLYRYNFWDV